MIGALAMSEPNAGSDVVSMKLRADKKGRLKISILETQTLKVIPKFRILRPQKAELVRGYKLFSNSTQLSRKFTLLINVKCQQLLAF